MPELDVKHGMFCWTDLSTPDPDGVRPFYESLFGWSSEETPGAGGQPYTVFSLGDDRVAGMMSRPPEHMDSASPPVWSSYVAVDDVDGVTARARELGGSVELEPVEVPGAGRMSVLRDPTGGVLCLWEASEPGTGLYNEPGTMIWNELATRDAARAVEFYGALLGWEFETMETHGTTYHVIENAGRQNGGILQMTDEWPEEIPAHWMVYFAVEDAEEAAAKLGELGGEISVPPTDIEVGVMSVVADPMGGTFTLFENRRGEATG